MPTVPSNEGDCPMKSRQLTRRQLATYRGRGYVPSPRARKPKRAPIGPRANVRQKAFIRRQFRRGFTVSQIGRVLRNPLVIKRKTGGKRLTNRRVKAVIRSMRKRDQTARTQYVQGIKKKWGYTPSATNRLRGLLAHLTHDPRWLTKLEREGYSLG